MSSLIERQAAINALERRKSEDSRRNACIQEDINALQGLSHTLDVQQWIPCSERLPEDEEEVIVSVRDDSGDNTLDYSSCGWYACAGDFWVVDNVANERVVAWMPLPAPYRREGR